jgi:hypothetical protein
VRLEEADGEEERGARPIADQLDRGGADLVHGVGLGVPHDVVAEIGGIGGDVLLADHRRPVAGVAQCVEQVLARVVEREPAVRQPVHPVAVRPAAGKERGAAG